MLPRTETSLPAFLLTLACGCSSRRGTCNSAPSVLDLPSSSRVPGLDLSAEVQTVALCVQTFETLHHQHDQVLSLWERILHYSAM